MKGLSTYATFFIILAVVVIGIALVATGALNTFIEAFGIPLGDKPLKPIEGLTEKNIKVECAEIAAGTQNLFEYKLTLASVSLRFEGDEVAVPVFFFKGYTGLGEPALKFSQFEVQETIKSMAINSEIPPTGSKETLTLILMKRDVNCINIAKNSVSVEEFTKKCAGRVLGIRSSTAPAIDITQCTKPGTGIKQIYITLDNAEVYQKYYCKVKFTITNKDNVEWKEDDKIKVRVWCLGDNVGNGIIPVTIDDFIKLQAGDSKAFDIFSIQYGTKLCTRWDESILTDEDLKKKYANGWRIDLLKNCDDSATAVFNDPACCNFKDKPDSCAASTYKPGSEPQLISSITFKC